ncbi:MAG: glutamate-5-semialdehyde dehydrogenase [Lachnospiraceae bacterium]|nr:glutamate-5-semialdehyde dehydrogenase [Lachnospiraceae bacterium]
MTTLEILQKAKIASLEIGEADTDTKNRALNAMADALVADTDKILAANDEDVEAAKGKITDVMIDRLRLTKARIEDMAQGIRGVVALPDPVGRVLTTVERPNGLVIKKMSTSLGVVAIIYESRPNVTSDAASLAIKSGNACVLRSGKEAHRSSEAIVQALKKGLASEGLNEDALMLIEDTTHASSEEIMKAVGLVDLLIPRGGKRLIEACVANALVPCIHTGDGICHVYVDKAADLKMAVDIVKNAKTSRPSVCNACETCLVHRDIAEEFLPMLKEAMPEVELHCDERAYAIVGGVKADENTFDTEYLDYKISIGVVDDVKSAIAHIRKHSTGHSESIVTGDKAAADAFIKGVDSAAVYVNASTRFTDGGEFGLGCEMGISTQKLHARGPMGLEELCSYKYVIEGNGQIR